jgi:hypothetical protein
VAAVDAMTIRLHLRAMRVLAVVEDLPERLVVAVVAISSVARCGACGTKTARVHATGNRAFRPVGGRRGGFGPPTLSRVTTAAIRITMSQHPAPAPDPVPVGGRGTRTNFSWIVPRRWMGAFAVYRRR